MDRIQLESEIWALKFDLQYLKMNKKALRYSIGIVALEKKVAELEEKLKALEPK